MAPEVEKIVAPAIVDAVKDVALRIVTLQAGVIKNIKASVGSIVKKGTPLLTLDDTASQNNLIIQKNTYHQALNSLALQQKQLSIAEQRLNRAKRIDPRAISKSDMQDRVHDVEVNKLQLSQANLNLSNAMINLKNSERALAELTIKAPIDGIVLQIDAHLGEFVGGGQSLILLGDADKVIVRVSIDERDMPHFRKDARAYITSIDGSDVKIPVIFSQLNRYIVIPDYLNTRCQEAIFYFKRSDHPSVVAGQQFEATINLADKG